MKSLCPEKLHKMIWLINHVFSGLDVPEQYGVDSWGVFRTLACDTSRRVPGLGTAMVHAGFDIMKNKGVDVVTAMTTSKYSGNIVEGMGFDKVSSLAYSDYTDNDGQPIFPPVEPHTHAKLWVKVGMLE